MFKDEIINFCYILFNIVYTDCLQIKIYSKLHLSNLDLNEFI